MLKIIKNTFPVFENVPRAISGDIVRVVKFDLVRISDNKIVFSKPKNIMSRDGIAVENKSKKYILLVEPFFIDVPDVYIKIQYSEQDFIDSNKIPKTNTWATVYENIEKKDAYLNYSSSLSMLGKELVSFHELYFIKSEVPIYLAKKYCIENNLSFRFCV